MLIYRLGQIYGAKLSVLRGKVHDYLGMDLDFSEDHKIKIFMVKCNKKILKDSPEVIKGKSATPAADHLFKIREDGGKKLPEEKVQAFHTSVAQVLFLCQRTRPDILTPVSFLVKRVTEPDEDDRGELKHILKYLNGKLYMKLVLSAAYNLNTVQLWVNVSYEVYWDMKGHMGMGMSPGKGAMNAFLGQKVNTRSSTEAEIMGIDNIILQRMWGMYFWRTRGIQ